MLDIQALIRWLAAQPPFVQIPLSLVFFILIAPAILTAVAITAERIEQAVAVAVIWLVQPGLKEDRQSGVERCAKTSDDGKRTTTMG